MILRSLSAYWGKGPICQRYQILRLQLNFQASSSGTDKYCRIIKCRHVNNGFKSLFLA